MKKDKSTSEDSHTKDIAILQEALLNITKLFVDGEKEKVTGDIVSD